MATANDLLVLHVECARDRLWRRTRIQEFERVMAMGLGACWVWQGAVATKSGYGTVTCNRKTRSAHRVSWVLTNGDLTGGLHVLHKCDVRTCIRPSHLFLGTHSDNMLDCSSKGRLASCPTEKRARGARNGARKHPELHPRGESSGRAKLNDAAVRQIRQAYSNGRSIKGLAREHGVSRPTIKMVVTRQTWSHVA